MQKNTQKNASSTDPASSTNLKGGPGTKPTQPPIQTGGLRNYFNKSQSATRSASGKLIATILSLVVLLAGIMAGVFLTRQSQDIRKKASESECSKSENCINLTKPGDSGSYTTGNLIHYVFLTDENGNTYTSGTTEDGCYRSSINNNTLLWERLDNGDSCGSLVNIQIWTVNRE